MKAPTPGPWRLASSLIVVAQGRGRDRRHETVAGCYGEPWGLLEAEANAKFIVRACNAHDELVAMLLSLEWSAVVDHSKGGTNDGCPSCDGTKPGSGDEEYEGHAEECALDTLIEKAGGRQ